MAPAKIRSSAPTIVSTSACWIGYVLTMSAADIFAATSSFIAIWMSLATSADGPDRTSVFVAASAAIRTPWPAAPRRPVVPPVAVDSIAATSVARALSSVTSSVRTPNCSVSMAANTSRIFFRLPSLAVTIRELEFGSAVMVTTSPSAAPRPVRVGRKACASAGATSAARACFNGISVTGRLAVEATSIFAISSATRAWSSFVARTTIELLLRSALIRRPPAPAGCRPRPVVAVSADVSAAEIPDASAYSIL